MKKYKIIIELDGEQHFKQVGKWQSPELRQECDRYKMEMANENGFSVIRISQHDIYHNKIDWLDIFEKYIEQLRKLNSEHTLNIYISSDNAYAVYRDHEEHTYSHDIKVNF